MKSICEMTTIVRVLKERDVVDGTFPKTEEIHEIEKYKLLLSRYTMQNQVAHHLHKSNVHFGRRDPEWNCAILKENKDLLTFGAFC